MATLTRESSIKELVENLQGPGRSPVRIALWATYAENNNSTQGRINRQRFTEHQIHSLGDLLAPKGEAALRSLVGTGPKSMIALQRFLNEKGFETDWPTTTRQRDQRER
jgi:hypothetical protein